MRPFVPLALLAVMVGGDVAAAQPAASSAAPPKALVRCRVLEAHTDATLGVTLVVFRLREPPAGEK